METELSSHFFEATGNEEGGWREGERGAPRLRCERKAKYLKEELHDGKRRTLDNNLKTSRKGASNIWSQQAPKNSKNHEAESKKLEEVVIKEDHQR